MNCSVCKEEGSTGKYKCPKCYTPYCSLNCWKEHKNTDCEPPLDSKELGPSPRKVVGYEHPTEDTIPEEKLALLKNNKNLKNILSNPHVRDIILAIDKSSDPSDILHAAMLEPIFVEFVDECLKVVQPQ